MKTDEFFYELFKIDPHSLFRLVHLNLEGEYTFESLTTKTTEKRFDGFCKRIDGIGPNIFLEIQGYHDPNIYWRLFREICTYYEQTGTVIPFIAIVLFLDSKYDPKKCPLSCTSPHRLIRANLVDCLDAIKDEFGILTVLKPLASSSEEEIFHQAGQWKADIHTLQLPEHIVNTLIGLLEYLILQRFPKIRRKELENMLHLTPLEKTAAGQEVFQMGKKEGLLEGLKEGLKEGEKEGLRKGELIGEIRLAQRLLKHTINTIEELSDRSLQELEEMFQRLDAEFER